MELDNRYSSKLFFAIALPIIIQGMVFQLQSIVDKAFLGNLNTDYLTAIGVTQSPFHMTMTLITAITTGLGIVVGHRYGAKEFNDMKEAIRSTSGFNVILGVLLFLFWHFFGSSILGLMKVEEKVIPYAMSYLRIIALYLPLFAIDSSLQAALQAFGKTKPIMYVGLIKVFLNLGLDWIFIFGRFGFPAMGIEGAALATLVSNIVASIALISYFYTTESLPIPMKFREIIGFHKKTYVKIVKIGLPTGLEFFLWFIGNLVLITLLNTLDSNGVAVYVLTSSIGVIVFMVYVSFSRATMTLISQCIGAKDYHAIPKIMTRSVLYNILVITVFIVIVLIFQRPFLDVFTDDLELMNLTIPMMGYLMFTIYPKSMNVLIGHGIRALGKTSWMLYTQIAGTVFVITVSFVLVKYFDLGLEAIFITILCDEAFRSVLNTYYFIYQTRTKRIMKHKVL